MPDPRLAYYGSRPDPNGRGTLVKTADGREALFLTAPGRAYTPGPAPTSPPVPVEAPARTGYEPADVTAMRILAQGRATRERQDASRAPPMSLADVARSRAERVAPHLGGVAPGSPEARVEEAKRVADRPGDAARTFARSTAAGALDTAALPVTLPARAARAAGVPGLDTVADLQADEALQDATWLATGEEAGDYRKRVAQEREDFPTVADAGAEVGAGLAAAPVGVAARELRRGAGAARIAASAAEAPANAQQGAYARGEKASDAEIGASAAMGAGMAGVTGAAGVLRRDQMAGIAKKQPDLRYSYWRVQDADYPLSKKHRSKTWSLDENDPGVTHRGTSAVASARDIPRAQAYLDSKKDVEIVFFEGDPVGSGWDGEPVVIPERELARWRAPAGTKVPPHVRGVDDLRKAGFKRVETRPVE